MATDRNISTDEAVTLADRGTWAVRAGHSVTQYNGSHVTPSNAGGMKVDGAGSVQIGPNEILVATTGSQDQSIPDGLYAADGRRWYLRSLRIADLGDPPDLVIGRAGPGNIYPVGSYPDTSDFPITSGTNIGTLRWQGWCASTSTDNKGFQISQATIYARASEDLFKNSSQDLGGGGELWFATTPTGTGTPVDRLSIANDGTVGVESGNLKVKTAGKGLYVKEGSNARMGTATLSSGAVTVTNTSVTASTRIFLTVQAAGGTQGFLSVTRSASTSFTIASTSNTDTSTVAWLLVEPS